MNAPDKSQIDRSTWNGIRREGRFHTFDDKQPGFFPLIVWTITNEQSAPSPHTHDFYELVYVRRGSAVHCYDGNEYPVRAGDCFCVLPNEDHGFDKRHSFSLTNVLFYPTILIPHIAALKEIRGFAAFFCIEPFFRSETSFAHKLHLSLTQQDCMSSLLDTIEKALDTKDPGWQAEGTGLFLQLVVMASRFFGQSIAADGMDAEYTAKLDSISAAIAFLEKNYSGEVKLDDVARNAFLSPNRLCSVFKAAVGMTIVDYLTKVRIEKACQLLLANADTVTEIASKVGYHDPSYFGRTFKAHMGHTPSEHLKKIKQS